MARRRRRNVPVIPITIQTESHRSRHRYGNGGGSNLGLLALYGVGAYLLYQYAQQPAGAAGYSTTTTQQGILPGTKYIQGVGRPGPNQTYWVNDAGYVVLSDGPPDIEGNWSPASGADLTAAGLLGAPAG